MNELLQNKTQICGQIGISPEVFEALNPPFYILSKRKMYFKSEVEQHIRLRRQEPEQCQSTKSKGRPTSGMTSQSAVFDFETVRKQIKEKKRLQSMQNEEARL